MFIGEVDRRSVVVLEKGFRSGLDNKPDADVLDRLIGESEKI